METFDEAIVTEKAATFQMFDEAAVTEKATRKLHSALVRNFTSEDAFKSSVQKKGHTTRVALASARGKRLGLALLCRRCR